MKHATKFHYILPLLLSIGCQLVFADSPTAQASPHLLQLQSSSSQSRQVDNTLRQQHLSATDPKALEILKFWFEEWDTDIQQGGKGKYNDKWFPHGPKGAEGSKEIDRIIREKFLSTFELATADKLKWNIKKNPYENLAFILLIDQFSRNMFRGTERAYINDPLARKAVDINIKKGFAKFYFTGYQKLFVVYPLMHHESLQSQEKSLRYLKKINEYEQHQYEFLNALQKGVEHYQVIYMFGRFPHRNERQNRNSSTKEAAYLSKKGSAGFVDGSKW